MTTENQLRAIALAFPHALEKPHFDRAGFRVDVPKGKMFCTLAAGAETCNVFLRPEEQAMLVGAEPDIFFKVPNKWGDKGATSIRLAACDEITTRSALALS
jgi:hypothetical protein